MHWTDNAIILSTRKHGESAGIVSLMTENHGLFNGLVRGISSKKQCGIYQIGNQIEATWRGRLTEHLGNFTAELQFPNAAVLMSCPRRLSALNSICTMLAETLPEREQANNIYTHLQSFIDHLKNDDFHNPISPDERGRERGGLWQIYYILMEIDLLSHLGFRLDLSSCAATGATQNLKYISPKSGRAVCASAGEQYKDKLLLMPDFLINPQNWRFNAQEIQNGLQISSYFLEKYIFKPHNKSLPIARLRFSQVMREDALTLNTNA